MTKRLQKFCSSQNARTFCDLVVTFRWSLKFYSYHFHYANTKIFAFENDFSSFVAFIVLDVVVELLHESFSLYCEIVLKELLARAL